MLVVPVIIFYPYPAECLQLVASTLMLNNLIYLFEPSHGDRYKLPFLRSVGSDYLVYLINLNTLIEYSNMAV